MKHLISKTIGRLATGYGMLLCLAAGGLVFANFFGFFVGLFEFGTGNRSDPSILQAWTHRGWIFGVCFALLSIVMKKRKGTKKQASQSRGDLQEQSEPRQKSRRTPRTARRYGFLASTALGGLGGALLGGMLGGTFILLWFSMTYSPFAPQAWVSSVSMERERLGSARRTPVASTDHPVALIAFGAPLALGTVAGAVFGGVGGVTEEK